MIAPTIENNPLGRDLHGTRTSGDPPRAHDVDRQQVRLDRERQHRPVHLHQHPRGRQRQQPQPHLPHQLQLGGQPGK